MGYGHFDRKRRYIPWNDGPIQVLICPNVPEQGISGTGREREREPKRPVGIAKAGKPCKCFVGGGGHRGGRDERMEYMKADIGMLILRVSAGLFMATHGFGKIFGGRMEGFASGVEDMGFPLPVVFAWAAALSELVGGVFVALGLFTRISAFFVACTMFVAGFIRHGADPFSDKEMALLYLAINLFFLLAGGGRWTVDALIRKVR